MTPDEKIRWLIEHDLIFDQESRHEVFQVLRLALPTSTPKARALLLERTMAGPKFDETDDEQEKTRLAQLAEYTIYNALNWFIDIAPSWADAVEAQAQIQGENPKFKPRDRPDFTHYSWSGDARVKPPKSTEEMIEYITKEGADTSLGWLLGLDYSEQRVEGRDWDGALSLIRDVATSAPGLGVELLDANALIDEGERRTGITASILSGWAAATSALPWTEILARVDTLAEGGDFLRELSDLFVALSRDEQSGVAPSDLGHARQAAATMWTKHSRAYTHNDTDDWMMLGLNTWPGNLARFWTFEISRSWRVAGDGWAGLDREERAAVSRMVMTKLSAGDGPRAIFGSELYFLFGADSDFTVRTLFPLFAATSGSATAQVWQGYLHHPRVNNRMLELGFLELVRGGRSTALSLEAHNLADQYFLLVASICSYCDISDDERTALLNELVLDGGEDQTVHFVQALVQLLSQAENDQAAGQLWDAWIAAFYRKRVDGRPREPTAKELSAWADLVLVTGPGLPEAVNIMLRRPVSLGNRMGLMRLDDTKAAEFPQQLVRYLQHRVDGTSSIDIFAQHYVQSAVQSLARAAGKAALAPVVDKLANLGAGYASQWLDDVDQPK